MILKLRNGNYPNHTWWLLDNIIEIKYEHFSYGDWIKRGDEFNKSSIPQYPRFTDSNHDDKDRICQIIIESSNHFFSVIYTDDVVYVLNNDGKTVDSINS